MKNGVTINGIEYKARNSLKSVYDACAICALKRICDRRSFGGTMFCGLFNKLGYVTYFVKAEK